ncbi:MAG TPA: M28 family peptidase [Gemmatimonadaceae bacterium]
MRRFALLGCAALACTRALVPSPARTSTDITPADVRQRIFIVADDSMAGRQAGYVGNYKMTAYLERELVRLGLEPAGDSGTFFQTIPLVRRRTDSTSTLSAGATALRLFVDFAPIRPTSTVRSATRLDATDAPVVFGGRAGDSVQAITSAQSDGSIVVFSPPVGSDGRPSAVYSTAMGTEIARHPRAAAIAVASLDFLSPASLSGLKSASSGLLRPSDIAPFALLLSTRAAETLMGAKLDMLRPGVRGRSATAMIRFVDSPPEALARNVVAILRGSDPTLRREYIAIGAHSDHLGTAAEGVDHDSLRAYNAVLRPEGAQSRTRAGTPAELATARATLDSLRKIRPPRRDSIYNGADDDGSGSVAELEIAEALAAGKPPRRSILFVWHTAEEAGLLGSWWFTDNPTVPRDSIVAQLNMDMVGRGRAVDRPGGGPRSIQLIGSRRLSTELGDLIDSVNAARAFHYSIDYSFDAPRHPQNRYCRSDHQMYARYGIPITYFSRGYHIDYHLVTDEAQYIDYEGLAHVAEFVRDVATALGNRDRRPGVDKPRPNPVAPCRQ